MNQRLNLRMDVPMRRETALSLFDRVKREHAALSRLRRYEDELALESSADGEEQQWLGLRRTSIRSGAVNPRSPEEAYGLHKLVLEMAPAYLDISALDVDYLELLYGFDLMASGNHDEIVYEALVRDSALAKSMDEVGAKLIDCQPSLGLSLSDDCDLQAHFEVKTRTSARQVRSGEFREEPISLYLTVRKYAPVDDIKSLAGVMDELREHGQRLVETRLIPAWLMPIRDRLALGNI